MPVTMTDELHRRSPCLAVIFDDHATDHPLRAQPGVIQLSGVCALLIKNCPIVEAHYKSNLANLTK